MAFTKTGDYTVKTGYWRIKQQDQLQILLPSSSEEVPQKLWRRIWSVYVPQKIKIFIWKVCHNILLVKSSLHKKKISPSSDCLICHQEAETLEHTFLRCPWTRPVWFGLGISPDLGNLGSVHKWLEQKTDQIDKLPDQREFLMTNLFCALWGIWKSRNFFIYEGTKLDPTSTMLIIKGMISDYSSLIPEKMRSGSHSSNRTYPWRPPQPNFVKLNVDASFIKDSGKACTGIVGRNHKGEIITSLTRKTLAQTPLMAEAIALREAMSLAANLQIDYIVVESDSLDLIKTCRNEQEIGEIRHIYQDIRHLKQSFQKYAFTWVHHSGNLLAHTIAKMHSRDILPTNWRWAPPLVLKEIIEKEKNGTQNQNCSDLPIQDRLFTGREEREEITLLPRVASTLAATPSNIISRSFPHDPGIIS